MKNFELQVQITESDRNNGKPCDGGSCPLSLAIQAVLRNTGNNGLLVSVGIWEVQLFESRWHPGIAYEAKVPPEIEAWLFAFDQDRETDLPEPFMLRFEQCEHPYCLDAPLEEPELGRELIAA